MKQASAVKIEKKLNIDRVHRFETKFFKTKCYGRRFEYFLIKKLSFILKYMYVNIII